MSLFLVGEMFGLFVTSHYITKELPYGLKPPEIQQNYSPWFLLGAVLVASAFILFIQRFKFDFVMKAWFYFAFVVCVSVSLSVFIESWIAVVVAAFLVILKFKASDLYAHNITEVLIYGGLVALFASIFNIWTAILVLVLISIYDVIAVFVTKHMITLAHFQEKLGIFAGFIVVNKNETAILGGGDVAFTLLFATVALKAFGLISALFAVYGAAMAITVLMLIGKEKKYYPAMPFITLGALLGLAITII